MKEEKLPIMLRTEHERIVREEREKARTEVRKAHEEEAKKLTQRNAELSMLVSEFTKFLTKNTRVEVDKDCFTNSYRCCMEVSETMLASMEWGGSEHLIEHICRSLAHQMARDLTTINRFRSTRR
jgi:hypothetical protein